MADLFDDVDEDDYLAEPDDEAELTGKEPKFLLMEDLHRPPNELADMRVDELVQSYIGLRNQLATDRKGYKQREASVKGRMEIISMILRDRADSLGVESFRTDYGTAYRNIKEAFRVTQWDDVVRYIKETGNYHILQKRVSPNAVKDVRTIDGELPPGLESRIEVEFAVRSPTARKKSTSVG